MASLLSCSLRRALLRAATLRCALLAALRLPRGALHAVSESLLATLRTATIAQSACLCACAPGCELARLNACAHFACLHMPAAPACHMCVFMQQVMRMLVRVHLYVCSCVLSCAIVVLSCDSCLVSSPQGSQDFRTWRPSGSKDQGLPFGLALSTWWGS